MFDLLMRDEGGAGVPVPLPGRGMVYLGADGLLYTKGHDGTVNALPAGPAGDKGDTGDKGDVLVPALSVGAYAVLGAPTPAPGDTFTTNGSNATCWSGSANVQLPVGQVWRFMGGWNGGPPSAFLYQRVS